MTVTPPPRIIKAAAAIKAAGYQPGQRVPTTYGPIRSTDIKWLIELGVLEARSAISDLSRKPSRSGIDRMTPIYNCNVYYYTGKEL